MMHDTAVFLSLNLPTCLIIEFINYVDVGSMLLPGPDFRYH